MDKNLNNNINNNLNNNLNNNINNEINNNINHSLINNILNIITILIIIYYIYLLIQEYYNYKKFDEINITKSTDFDIISDNYKDCKLYHMYNNLSDKDKEYLYHIINGNIIKYKEEKPKLKKNINNVKNQLFINMIITLLIKQKLGAAFDSLKHNTLLTFIAN